MASALMVSKKVICSRLLTRLLLSSPTARPIAAGPSAIRSFNTKALLHERDADDRDLDSPRPRGRDFVAGRVLDPFLPSRSLSQVFNMMDQMMENPLGAAALGRGLSGGLRRGWDAREDDAALHLKVDMPGLGKEHVKISVEQNTLVIRGEGEKESEEEEYGRRYSSRIDLPQDVYRLDQIKAEMKHGVLKIVVPKFKEEERKDVFQVKIG